MDKGMEFLLLKNYYYDNGAPRATMELKDKKKLVYTYTEYHPNGTIKVQGTKIYDRFDYLNHGDWKYFDENGKVEKEEHYDKGERA